MTKSLLYQLTLGMLIGIVILPVQPANAQLLGGIVFDIKNYALQVEKRLEEANRYTQMFDNAAQRLTTLRGVLQQAEELVAKNRNAIVTMSNIGRTVRASLQLEEQFRSIIKTRLTMLKSIDDRLHRGILNPEADLRDLEDYLRRSIGRSSQDAVANLERLQNMDNTLNRLLDERDKANASLAKVKTDRKNADDALKAIEDQPEAQRCASCIANLNTRISNCDLLIAHYTSRIDDLICQIEDRVMRYQSINNERWEFGQEVNTTNKAWSEFNNTLDEIQSTLRKY
jgi:chromosome segregation ATPase